jgi:hypothetical protein
VIRDIGELRDACGHCTQEEIVEACQQCDPRWLEKRGCPDISAYEGDGQAKDFIMKNLMTLLNVRRYRAAARLLWGIELFDPRPRGVERMINAIESNAKVIVLGAASSGKSYSVVCWLILDWLRDPEYTGARIISVTGKHAKSNTFSSIQRFYESAIIKLPGESQDGFIGLNPKDRHASISVVAIKQGESGTNSLQGFHPIRRREAHPQLGALSRIRLFLDEAEMIPPGVWRGVGNLLSNLHGDDTVKVIAAANPWDVTSILAATAEPKQGYGKVDPDVDKEWTSRTNWKVVRVDAADSENVKARKIVYEGLMTYEGFQEYQSKTNGDDPNYWCYARGMYPLKGAIENLIPMSYLDDFFGEYLFQSGTVVGCAGVDLAFEGDDEAVYFTGRYGKAHAWRPAGTALMIPLANPRYVLQLDQYRSLPKLRTEGQFNQIRQISDAFGVSYDWLALDKTGVGKGVADLFYERGYRNTLAIAWGSAATQEKILDEDRHVAHDVCDGIAYEMYWTFRNWLEFGFVKASPNIDMNKLQKELCGRKRKSAGLGPTGEPRYRLEKKEDFKARYGFSPDRADAMVMCLHVARMRGPERAQMAKKKRLVVNAPQYEEPTNISHIDFSTD